jgi:alpha-L-fucosidase
MGEYIRSTFAHNLAETAVITADFTEDGYPVENVKTNDYDTYYKPADGENAVTLTVKLDGVHDVSHVVIKEHIPLSQRVESYAIDVKLADGSYSEIASGTTIGYQKIERFAPVATDEIRIRIIDSRVCPVLSFVGVY